MFRYEYAKQLVNGSRLKRSAIAEECRIARETLTHYLCGQVKPSRAVVALMAIVLKVPESDLWAEEPTATKKAS